METISLITLVLICKAIKLMMLPSLIFRNHQVEQKRACNIITS